MNSVTSRSFRAAMYLGIALLAPTLASGERNVLAGSSPALVSETGTAIQGGALWDQTDACGGNAPASQQFPDFGNAFIQSADDFTVPPGVVWHITSVTAQGLFFNGTGPLTGAGMQIWSSNGTLPATLICEEIGANDFGGGPNMGYTPTGACAAPLPEGEYFVSIFGVMSFSVGGQVAWLPNATAAGNNEFAFQDPDGLTGNPCNSWGAGISTCGIGSSFPDLCFAINGTEEAAVLTPAVPTLNPLGIVALLLGLSAAGFLLIRHRRRVS